MSWLRLASTVIIPILSFFRWRMLERRKAHTAHVNDHNVSPPADQPTPESDNSSTAMPPPWDLGMSYIDPTGFWPSDTQYASPAEESNDIPLHPSAYLSPHYSGDLEPGEIIEAFPTRPPTPPPPFQFTSSSLSSALSLSAISPSTAYVGSPTNIRVPEISINNIISNHIHCSNTTQSQVSSSTAFAGEVGQTSPHHLYNPPSPRYSPDLSALGSQDISVPVPFDDTQHECNSTYDTAVPESQVPRDEVQSYPTPEASPHLDESSATLASPAHAQEVDRDPTRHYRTPAQKKKAAELKTTSGVKKSNQKNALPRLSASLPASSE